MRTPLAEHGPDCECQRCRGFEPGNQVSVGNRGNLVHGAYSSALDRHPRVLELTAEARATAPWLQPADEHALRLWAMAVVRLELLAHVLLPPLEEGPEALEEWARKVESSPTTSRDARGWHANAMRLADRLGLSPSGRAEIEERERSVIATAEAQALFSALFTAAATFIPAGLRTAFLERVDEARQALPIERPVLEAGPASAGEEPTDGA